MNKPQTDIVGATHNWYEKKKKNSTADTNVTLFSVEKEAQMLSRNAFELNGLFH